MRVLAHGAVSGSVFAELLWEPRDAWVGVFVDPGALKVRVFVCLLPFFPVCFTYYRRIS